MKKYDVMNRALRWRLDLLELKRDRFKIPRAQPCSLPIITSTSDLDITQQS